MSAFFFEIQIDLERSSLSDKIDPVRWKRTRSVSLGSI